MDAQDTKQNASNLISAHFGYLIGEKYANFYKNKDDQTIVSSISGLMEEVLGPEKAKEEMLKHHLISS